jgi:benzoate membrane transport protein
MLKDLSLSAICRGRESHEDPSRRWVASAAAGFALLGTIGAGLAAAMRDERQREPAPITFLVTASGLTLWGVGAAF